MIGLYKDPEGSTIFEKSEGQGSMPASNFQTQTIDSLKQRVKDLEEIVTELQVDVVHKHVYYIVMAVTSLYNAPILI